VAWVHARRTAAEGAAGHDERASVESELEGAKTMRRAVTLSKAVERDSVLVSIDQSD